LAHETRVTADVSRVIVVEPPPSRSTRPS
jgi:hypothetical protein